MPTRKTIKFNNLNLEVEFVIGKNAKENFDIIDDASGHHIWFHVKDSSSSHVIARLEENLKKKDLRYILKQGAILCKQYSKMASAKNVEIIYSNVCNVTKTNIIGTVNVSNEKSLMI